MSIESLYDGPDRLTGDVWSSPETAERVLDWLRNHAGTDGVTDASRRRIGADLGLSPATMRRALRRLADEQRIALVRRGTGERYASRFRVVSSTSAA